MKKLKISANLVTNEKASDIRKEGFIPGVLYGPKQDSSKVKVDNLSFVKLLRSISKSTIIDIDLDGKIIPVLIHEVQRHPVSEEILSFDFYALDINKPVNVTLNLHFIGDAPGVRNYGGILVSTKNEISIKCLPKDLISSFDIDVSGLDNIGKSIHVRDLKLPNDIEILDNKDVTLVHIIAPKVAQETDEVEEVGEIAVEGEETEQTEAKKE